MLICFIHFSMFEKRINDCQKISRIEKSKLPCHSNQTYEIFHYNCYILTCLIHFSLLENLNSGLQQVCGLKEAVYVAIEMKNFIRPVRY